MYVNAVNFGEGPLEFLTTIPAQAVQELHLAGFDRFGRWLVDTHGRVVHQKVWELYEWTIGCIGPRPTLIEWDTNLPTLAELVAQARQADAILRGSHVAAS